MIWWNRWVTIPLPLGCKPSALPIELLPHYWSSIKVLILCFTVISGVFYHWTNRDYVWLSRKESNLRLGVNSTLLDLRATREWLWMRWWGPNPYSHESKSCRFFQFAYTSIVWWLHGELNPRSSSWKPDVLAVKLWSHICFVLVGILGVEPSTFQCYSFTDCFNQPIVDWYPLFVWYCERISKSRLSP